MNSVLPKLVSVWMLYSFIHSSSYWVPCFSTMLMQHSCCSCLNYLLFQPCHQSPSKQGLHLQVVHKAIVSNVRQFFNDTKQSRDSRVVQMRNQMLQVILHDHGMKETIGHKVSDRQTSCRTSVCKEEGCCKVLEEYHTISKSAGTQEKDWAHLEVIYIPAQPAMPHYGEVLAR